jgi:predicted nucleic acid-binding protein
VILVDTSVWIDHLRKSDAAMFDLLKARKVLTHSLVIGEISVGSYRNRDGILSDLALLPVALAATDSEVLQFISRNKLFGIGIGYIDAHLLAAVQLTPGTALWTRDKRLDSVAAALGLRYLPLP